VHQIYENTKRELLDLASKYQDALNEIDESQQALTEAKLKYMEKCEQHDNDMNKLNDQTQFFLENERKLNAQVYLRTTVIRHNPYNPISCHS
jgi:hypothetical protein